MTDKDYLEENEIETHRKEWSPRKSSKFISLNDITPEKRVINDSFNLSKNFEKIQFICQPIDKEPSHISLDNLTKKSPVKEIVYRLLANHKRAMKLVDIVNKTREITKDRKLSTHSYDGHEYKGFYSVLKNDTHYGFEEVE
ncbi:hypothetical protein KKB99_03020 [bacterium]|nr:hypothetical protein [bacterium]MBU1024961.1 hypothetical protein [bacterium]